MGDIDPKRPDESVAEWVARVKPPDKPPPRAPEFDPDLIPEETKDTRFDKEREEIDAVLGRMDIVDAYNKYCGKMHVDPKGKIESIMVRCPFPGHADEHTSAWLTLKNKGDGGVGNCSVCGGFDKYDLAAWHFDMDVPGYKIGINFPELRRKMAEGLGYTVMVQGKDTWLEKSQPPAIPAQPISAPIANVQSEDKSDTPPTLHRVETEDTSDVAPVETHTHHTHLTYLDGNQDEDQAGFDWRTLPFITQDSDNFMLAWMTELSKTTQPDEFYFFLGLLALGVASGNKVFLKDETPVRSNLMVCLVGGTGTGKSRSIDWFHRLMGETLPYHWDTSAGVKMIYSTGSGEDLVDQMVHYTTDPVTKEKNYNPVCAVHVESEMEGLMARVNRAGSTLRSTIMKFNDSLGDVSRSSRSGGTAISKGHYLNTLTTTQPKRLSALLTTGDASSGFLNRWVFPFGTEKFRPSISHVQIDLTESVRLLGDVRGWSSPGKEILLDFDPAAVNLWDELVQTEIRPMEATDNLLVARIELFSKKLLLLMAINNKQEVISENHVRSLMMLFPYLKKCYGIVEKNVGVSSLDECIEAIRKYCASHPNDDITMRKLAQQSGARRFELPARNRAMEELEKAGEVMQIPRPKNITAKAWRYVQDQPAPLAQVIPIRQ